MRPSAKLNQRLVVQFEAAAHDRLAQIEFERAARFHARVHRDLEEAVGAAAVGLGAVHRQVGVLQEFVRIDGVLRRQRDADGGVGDELVAADVVRRGHRRENARDQRGDVVGLREIVADDGELVAAEPGDEIGLVDAGAQPHRHFLEQFVADRMAEAVVDALEAVEIEIEQRQPAAMAAHALERLLELLAEQHAVRQARQRVVMREMRDAPFRLLALGDVLDDREQVLRRAVRGAQW